MMAKRRLGRWGPMVSAVGLGCMSMSGVYGPADEAESTATIRRALDLGVSHLDTSASYGRGHNETLVGKAIAGRRDGVVLATKFGIRRSGDARWIDSSPEWARASCEESLRRLNTDVIDLFYVHRRNPAMPIEPTIAELARLVAEGKIRYLGLSEVSADTLRRAHAVHPIAALQIEYSLFSRDVEDELLPVCRELGVSLVAYAPLGSGLLTGGLAHAGARTARHGEPRLAPGNVEHNLRLVAALAAIAAELGSTPAQVSLAWLLSQGEDILPIPGTRRASRVAENLAATEIVLDQPHLDRIAAAVPKGSAAGERMGPAAAAEAGH
jgi:aryl-alcohol dehydrogenase-like predicted oxidoreductase